MAAAVAAVAAYHFATSSSDDGKSISTEEPDSGRPKKHLVTLEARFVEHCHNAHKKFIEELGLVETKIKGVFTATRERFNAWVKRVPDWMHRTIVEFHEKLGKITETLKHAWTALQTMMIKVFKGVLHWLVGALDVFRQIEKVVKAKMAEIWTQGNADVALAVKDADARAFSSDDE